MPAQRTNPAHSTTPSSPQSCEYCLEAVPLEGALCDTCREHERYENSADYDHGYEPSDFMME